MAGKVVVSTLNNDTGVLATQNGMTGIAKAWVNFDGTVSTPTIRGSFNVGSVTKNGTGDYTINFTTAMPNANYAYAGNTNDSSSLAARNVVSASTSVFTTSSLRINTIFTGSGANTDGGSVTLAVFSS